MIHFPSFASFLATIGIRGPESWTIVPPHLIHLGMPISNNDVYSMRTPMPAGSLVGLPFPSTKIPKIVLNDGNAET